MDRRVVGQVVKGAAGTIAIPLAGALAGDKVAQKAADAYNKKKLDKLKRAGASEDELNKESKKAEKRKKAARIALSGVGYYAGFAANRPARKGVEKFKDWQRNRRNSEKYGGEVNTP